MNKNKAVEMKKGESLEEFRARLRMETGLPAKPMNVNGDPGVVAPVASSVAAPVKTYQSVNTTLGLVRSEEARVVEPVSKVVSGASVVDVEKLIAKKKNRLFGKHEKLEDLSIADLEILRQQKVRDEQAERNRLEDERILFEMRQQKRDYYDALRNTYFKMSSPFEDRFVSFLNYYAANADRINVLKSRGLLLAQIRSEMELFGLKVSDKKYVFTDVELEQFRERCQAEKISCPFDSFAIHAMQTLRVRSDADVHRKQLMETVVGEKE